MAGLFVLLLGVVSGELRLPSQSRESGTAFSDLLVRVVGADAAKGFVTGSIPPKDGKDTMQLSSRDNKVLLLGSSNLALASALNWYLNSVANTSYDWNTYSLNLPSPLPLPSATETRTRVVAYSYYLNVCTVGYSLGFVDWNYWEKHIDWMALQGVNLPLAFEGQEYVWTLVFKQYNLSFTDLQDFYSGPGFLPWFRMGNLQGWGGPISEDFVSGRYELQKVILKRMRDLGMIPVLPAFSGHIPSKFLAKFPKLNVSISARWNDFPEPYGNVFLLESTDPMFVEIGTKFIATQTQLFGTDHVYNADTFNENTPRSSDPAYLKASSAAVYTAMAKADPKAIWLMQGWLFYNDQQFWGPKQTEAYLSGVSNDNMWILDLFAEHTPVWETTSSFYGKPFIWCTLLNFGGQQGLAGNLTGVVTGFQRALTASAAGVRISRSSTDPDNDRDGDATTRLIGVGITMEGIWQNYPVYEITLQLGWFGESKVNVPQWTLDYGKRRYGHADSDAVGAWKVLGDEIYNLGSSGGFGSIITRRPRLEASSSSEPGVLPPAIATLRDLNSSHCNFHREIEYLERIYHGHMYPTTAAQVHAQQQSQEGLSKALQQLGRAASRHDSPQIRFDLVDIARQLLYGTFSQTYQQLLPAFNAKDAAKVKTVSSRLLEIMDDLDFVLSSDVNFMLGPFIQSARQWGKGEYADVMEWNTRNQLTLWGPEGQINDYAAKGWGGLMRSYYRPRWALFLDQVSKALEAQKIWDQGVFNKLVLSQVEQPWQKDLSSFPVVPERDAIKAVATICTKYCV